MENSSDSVPRMIAAAIRTEMDAIFIFLLFFGSIVFFILFDTGFLRFYKRFQDVGGGARGILLALQLVCHRWGSRCGKAEPFSFCKDLAPCREVGFVCGEAQRSVLSETRAMCASDARALERDI